MFFIEVDLDGNKTKAYLNPITTNRISPDKSSYKKEQLSQKSPVL